MKTSAREAGKVDTKASRIIAELGTRPLVEVMRALQREEGCLTEESLRALAGSRMLSLTRIYGVASAWPEFSFEQEHEAERPASPAVGLPGFLTGARASAQAVMKSGPLTQRFEAPPASIGDYKATGGMKALTRVLDEMKPEQVLSEIVLGGLTRKPESWQQGRSIIEGPVIVVNCQAGDPSAAQVSRLLEMDAYAIIEGMFIGAVATGARRGFIVIDPVDNGLGGRLAAAAEEIQRAANINFAVDIFTGAGNLVASEDSATAAAIDGARPLPTASDPSLRGIGGRPVLVEGAECFAAITATIATGAHVDSRLYQVSGIAGSGIHEAEPSTSVRDIIAGAAHQVLIGGLSGVFLLGTELDQPLSSFQPTDSPRWRTILVFDEGAGVCEIILGMAAYNARYLCGRCIPCRIGAVRMAEMLKQEEPDVALITELASVLAKTGLCATGRGAGAMVGSAIKGVPGF